MLKRVSITRFVIVGLLLGVASSLGPVTGPVFAKQDISVGQAGDPGDGLDFAAGGSNGAQDNGGESSRVNSYVRPSPLTLGFKVLLVPVFDGVVPRFVLIRIPAKSIEQAK